MNRKNKYFLPRGGKLGESINNGKIEFVGIFKMSNILPSDSAIMFINKGLHLAAAAGFRRTGSALGNLATAYYRKGYEILAFVFAYKSIAVNVADNDLRLLVNSYWGVSFIYT